MKNTSNFIYGLVLSIGLVLLVFILILMNVGEGLLPDERTYTDVTLESRNEGWSRQMSDGSLIPIEVPGQYETDGTGQFVLVSRIDNAFDDRDGYLTFNSNKQDVEVYVDDELRYEFSTKDTRLFGSCSPGTYMFVPIHPSDIGKNIKIVLAGDNNYSGNIDKFAFGTQLGIVLYIYNSERYTLLLALFIFALGLIAFIIGISVKVSYQKTLPLFFSGWTVMCTAIWALAESSCRQLFISNFSLFSYMTYLSLIMLPIAMAFYFDSLQEGRYRIIYVILIVLAEFSAFIAIFLQFVNNTDLIGILPYAFAAIIISTLVFIITGIADAIQGKARIYRLEFIGIFIALVLGMFQMYVYTVFHPSSMNSLILMLGILALIVMSYIRALIDIRTLERDVYAAAQAHESSTAFLTRMSHEMRTPINAILGMNMIILRESKEENILDYARDVNGAGNYLLGIVDEVLDLAKVTAGSIEIEPEDYELMDMVRECYALVNPRAKASRLSFEVDMSDVLPATLHGDKERIIQIVTNLLTNAVKYTPEGRVTLSVQGKIQDGKLMLMVIVSDTGIGVAKENIPYLFDSFNRVGEFNKKRIEGTGLGLSITKQLVDLMGGSISVESELGKGSVFTVIIPQEIKSIEPCGIFSMGPNGDRRVADRNEVFDVIGRILVVDDVAINLRVFSMLLNNTDVTVDTAISGQEALEKIKRTKYDIIFIDHLMPGMDGVELKNILDGLEDNPNKDTPLVMQTANAVVGAKEEYEKMGFTDYIAKPIKEEELRRIIRKYII